MYMLLYGCRGMIHFTIVTYVYFGSLFPTKSSIPVLPLLDLHTDTCTCALCM